MKHLSQPLKEVGPVKVFGYSYNKELDDLEYGELPWKFDTTELAQEYIDLIEDRLALAKTISNDIVRARCDRTIGNFKIQDSRLTQ